MTSHNNALFFFFCLSIRSRLLLVDLEADVDVVVDRRLRVPFRGLEEDEKRRKDRDLMLLFGDARIGDETPVGEPSPLIPTSRFRKMGDPASIAIASSSRKSLRSMYSRATTVSTPTTHSTSFSRAWQ